MFLVLITVVWRGLLVLSQMNLILFFLKDCVPGFLTSICTNAVLLQLQFLRSSEACVKFSHSIVNETEQIWAQERISVYFDTSFHRNGHNCPVWGCLLHIFYVIDSFCYILWE